MTLSADELVELRDVRVFARSGRARQTRLRGGLSLQEVGQAVGVSAVSVYRWETSQRTPRGEPAVRYGRLLDSLRATKAAS